MTEFHNGNSEAALALIAHLPDKPGKHDPIWYWRVRILRAQIFMRRSQPADALNFLSSLPADMPDEIRVKHNLIAGQALCQTGKTEEALKRIATAESIVSSTMPSLRADLLYARGDCVSDSRPEEAMQLFSQSASFAHGKDSYLEARALAYQGFLLAQSHYYDKAIELFDQALTITGSPLLKQSLLGNKGWCSQELGEWIASGVYLKQAVEIASHVKDAKADHALWLIDLGHQQLMQMEFADAQQSFREGLEIAKDATRADLVGRCLIHSAATAIVQGNLVHAKEQIAAAEQINNLGEWKSYLMLTKARLLRLEGNAKASEVILNAVIAANPDDDVKGLAESGFAETFVAEKRIADADRMFQKAIATFERGFDRISSEQFRISLLDQEPFYDTYISFLFSHGRKLDALNLSERGRSRALAEARKLHPLGSPLDLRAIQRNLARRSNQIILAYWIGPKSYLWLISPTDFRAFTLPAEMDILREIEAYNRTTQDQSDTETAHGQDLFRMLVAPAAKFIPRDARVTIVPHRRLYKLNFETLITDGEKPHFWIEDVCIQNTSFLAALEKPEEAPSNYAKQLLLMGNPVQATDEFPGLSHAAQEMKTVAGRFKQSGEAIYVQADATPEAYDSSKPGQFRFLHFVTHGTASDLNPLESAIILSPGKNGFKLYARDIIKTKIHPELVTISSCYGAGTRQYSGEGLVGLSWAFLRAGAHNVIGALWETDDEANVKLMDTFYNEMGKRDDPAGALRTAKLELLHSNSFWKRPYYWAALQLYSSN